MNVLMLNYEFPPLGGGAATANYFTLRELARREGCRIDLVTSSAGRFRLEQFSPEITIHYLDIGKRGDLHFQSGRDLLSYAWKSFFYCRKLKTTNRYDCIHAFFGIPCGFIAMLLKLPYIVSLLGSDVPFHTPRFRALDALLFKRLSRAIWKKSAAVVANSAGLREEALASSPGQLIEVIYNGVDTAIFVPAKGDRIESPLTVLYVGRLAPHKGPGLLVQALAGLDGVKLILAGDGPQLDELRRLSREAKVDTTFTGKLSREAVIARLQEAHVFVMPSLNEGMSNAVLEAMACGLPIITTDVGGTDELLRGNGIIVAKGSIEKLHEAIRTYRDDRELCKVHGRQSRSLAEKMSWQTVADEYFNLYQRVAGRKVSTYA